jgi:hypothetical protein
VNYVGGLLKEIHKNTPALLQNTAVVLGDESLLNPLLNSIPEEIERVNITMGYPLQMTPLAGMFSQFFELFMYIDSRGWFYKHLLSFISNNYIQLVLSNEKVKSTTALEEEIKKRNWVYIDQEDINFLEQEHGIAISQLFFDPNPSPEEFLERCLALVSVLKEKFEEEANILGLEYLYRFYSLFSQLKEMLKKFPFIEDMKSLYRLFKELLASENVDFQGEPLEGLQIMGMLESRNLDFETVIITSVNEGILPSGKTSNSFIPYDVKTEFDLPTYKEKDAVYTYHFYRLLQRAKNIYIIYNTEPDVLEGGEKSRFITQLLTDSGKRTEITHVIATPLIHPAVKTAQHISKDSPLMERLKEVAAQGLSQTTLTEYIRNPIGFYKKTILQIEEAAEVEETIAANTFGTIIHDVLEELYLPFVGAFLTPEKLKALKPGLERVVRSHFAKTYGDTHVLSGKNLIAFKVVIRYLENFLTMEMKDALQHRIKILALEEKMRMKLPIPGMDFPVFLKGKLDRVDERDGVPRIIDYKTGNVKSSQVEISGWDEMTTDFEYSKAFQLLCYALMYTGENPVPTLEAGIISFKNLSAGIMPFATKDRKGSRKKHPEITKETLELFREQLNRLILEICDPRIPFEEKEV